MEAHLQAGIAIYNAGGFHAAHDAWEDHWLDLETGTDDEMFLHGLIQFTATVFHAHNHNWGGATGLAGSAREYLADLPAEYRGVNVGAVRAFLGTLESDPEYIERRRPIPLTHEGRTITTGDLDFEATCVVAAVLAEEHGYDEELIADAIEYARAAVAENETNRFVALLFDFVSEPEHRGIILQRMDEHVSRLQSREDDVSGLF